LTSESRRHQANVALLIPGEPGYSSHWNTSVVHAAEGVTVGGIFAGGYASDRFLDEGVLFDNVEDIRGAGFAGVLTGLRRPPPWGEGPPVRALGLYSGRLRREGCRGLSGRVSAIGHGVPGSRSSVIRSRGRWLKLYGQL
jgi:hypothetical protein